MSRDVAKDLPLGTDWEPEWSFTQKGADGVAVPKTGLTPTVFLSLTKAASSAAAIHATLSVSLTERGDKPGTYSGLIDRTPLQAQLSARVGQTIYEVVSVANDAQDYQALIVRDR